MRKVKKFFRISLAIFLILFLVSFFFPIKFCMKYYPSDGDKDFVVVRLDNTKNWWIKCGDKNGLSDWETISDNPVTIKGKNIQNIVSADLYKNNTPTYFILFGETEIKEYRKALNDNSQVVQREFIINCTDWDVYKEVNSTNGFRNIFSNKYLTIYDFKWFDNFRKFIWYYDEY